MRTQMYMMYAMDSIMTAVRFACKSLCRLDAVLLSNEAAGLCHKTRLSLSERSSLADLGKGGSNRGFVLRDIAKSGLFRIRGPDGLVRRFMIGLVCFRALDHGRPVSAFVVSG